MKLGLFLHGVAAIAASALLCGSSVTAQPVQYPRVNTSVSYDVDPAWPQKPDSVQWGHVPGVWVDKDQNILVFTRGTPPVQVYTPSGQLLRSWGQDFIKTAHYLKTDAEGNVWVVDVGQHVVFKCSAEGKLLKTLGTLNEPGCDERHFNKPTDIAISPAGDLFITDGYGNARVVHFDKNGKFIKAWGSLGSGPGQFSLVHAIVMDSKGRLYVADRNNGRIHVYSQAGELLDCWSNLMVPWGLWVTPQDEIWACGSSPTTWTTHPDYPTAPLGCPPKDQVVMRFTSSGKLLQLWTFPKAADGKEKPGELNWLHGIAFDAQGNLYASDIIGKRVQKFVRKQN